MGIMSTNVHMGGHLLWLDFPKNHPAIGVVSPWDNPLKKTWDNPTPHRDDLSGYNVVPQR